MTPRTGALAWSPDHPHAFDDEWTAPGGPQLAIVTWRWLACDVCGTKTACVAPTQGQPICDTCLSLHELNGHEERHAAVVRLFRTCGNEQDDRRMAWFFSCDCCCAEHTFASCLARVWNGCRSGLPYGADQYEDYESWKDHYVRFHDMKPEDF